MPVKLQPRGSSQWP